MTAQELIDELRVLPAETEVLIADWNEQHKAATQLTRLDFNEEAGTVTLEESVD
jgi:hypothetical protein